MKQRGWLAAGIATVALAFGAAGESGAAAFSVDTSRGDVAATLSWEKDRDEGWSGLWLTIERAGEVAYDSPVDFRGCEEPSCVPAAGLPFFDGRPTFVVRDLDDDGEPEVVAQILTSTGHCCTVAQVMRWDGERYERIVHDFSIPGYRLVDVGRDGSLEFSSADGRFAYAFDSFAGSWFPPRMWTYERGRFREVTRAHSGLIRRHARAAMRGYKRANRQAGPARYGGGALAAWVADQRLLGNGQEARRFLQREQRAGRLDNLSGYRSAAQYIRSVERKLRRWGY